MSFERFSSSDVYIYEHVGGFIECCGCWFTDWDIEPFPQLKTPREALAHLDRHEEVGHDIGGARQRIEKEYEGNLDKEIEPYITPPEVRERFRKKLKDLYENSEN